MADQGSSFGTHYIKPLNAHDGYHELVKMFLPYSAKTEHDRVLEECNGPHDEDSLAALALFARHDTECELRADLFQQAYDKRPLSAETIDELVAIRAERSAQFIVDRWLHVLWCFAEAKGVDRIGVADLNDIMLPTLTTETLVLFTKAPAMQVGIGDTAGNFTEVVDVTVYDGHYRKALSWLGAQLPSGTTVPDALVRIFADHDPPIRIEG